MKLRPLWPALCSPSSAMPAVMEASPITASTLSSLRAARHVAGDGEAVGGGDAGSGVARAEQIVFALLAAQKSAQAAVLAQRLEAVQSSRQHLVRVALMARCPR